MEYRNIPALDRKVSVIGLGCEGFLNTSQMKFDQLFAEALENGINFLDMYTPNPEFKRRVGQKIHATRTDFILQGHIGSIWENDEYLRTRDLEKIRKGFDEQLNLLNTDYLDIGMIHYVDDMEDFERIFYGPIYEYVKNLKENGKIHAIGVSSHNAKVALRAVEEKKIDVLMFSVNAAYDMIANEEDLDSLFTPDTWNRSDLVFDPAKQKLYEACEQNGVAIDVMKAFGGGDMLDEKLSPFKKAFTVSMCLDYCLSRPAVVSVMAGIHELAQYEQLMHYFQASQEEKDYAGLLCQIDAVAMQGNCLYCTHCYPCPKGIKIAEIQKFLHLCKAQGMVPETVQSHYDLLEPDAGSCIECHICESRCPFGVHITEAMKEAVKIFGH